MVHSTLMNSVRCIYEAPASLSPSWGHHRIFAQQAYAAVRKTQFVPIVATEAPDLARWFPVCWRREEDEARLVAFRSLCDNGGGYPADADFSESCLPFVLQAFPFVVPADGEIPNGRTIEVDRIIADAPTDIGAPILTPEGRFTRPAFTRAKIAVDFGRCLPRTNQFSMALYAGGFLERWPVDLDLGQGRRAQVDDLLMIAVSKLDDPGLQRLIVEFGVEFGVLIAAHRLSLFRISALLSAARRHVQLSISQDPSTAVGDS